MPVSVNAEMERDGSSGSGLSGRPSHDLSTAWVNLIALPIRLTRICRSRMRSPTTSCREGGIEAAGQLDALRVARGPAPRTASADVARAEIDGFEVQACPPRSSRNRECR